MPAFQPPPASGGSVVGTGSGAADLLNTNQAGFASELVKQTGLDPAVVVSWILAEEPKSASRAPWGANNWLNIGGPAAGPHIASQTAWADPITAADQTAAWMKGSTIPGFGKAGGSISSIIGTAGQSASAQINAIGRSGWGTSQANIQSLYDHTVSPDKSFIDKIAKGITGPIGAAINTAGDVAGGVKDVGTAVGNIAELLTSTQFWLRVGEAIAGVLLLYLGLHALTGQSSSVGGQVKHVRQFIPIPV